MRQTLEIVARIGAVERFVAEREVGDDVAFDRGLEQRPLEPGRVAQMAARDRAVGAEAQPDQHVAAEAFDQRQAFADFAGGRDIATAIGPSGRRARICSIRPRLCSISRMRIQTRALTSPSCEHRHVELQRVVGRIAGRAARVEGAARGAADIAAGAELPRELGLEDAGADGAVLQRGGVVVELDQRGKAPPDLRRSARAAARDAVGVEIGRDAARHDAVHHQAVAEAGVARRARSARAGCRNGRA